MDINSLLQGQLPDGLLDQISQQIGGDKEQTATAASGIISTLLGGLAQNAGSGDGAGAIANALDRDHNGSILDNLSSLFSGPEQATPTTNGAGILDHILGDKTSGAADLIGKLSGLSTDQSGNLMQILAPILMGALGKAKQEGGLDGGGIASLLTDLVTQQTGNTGSNPLIGMVSQFLDRNNDGNVIDDVAGMIGGFFKK
jgi:hypothetical protein